MLVINARLVQHLQERQRVPKYDIVYYLLLPVISDLADAFVNLMLRVIIALKASIGLLVTPEPITQQLARRIV